MQPFSGVNGRQVFVVEERVNPSADFFVLPALKKAGAVVHRCTFIETPEKQFLSGAVIIFIRYVPAAWKRLIIEDSRVINKIYFFMDDDLFDLRSFKSLPLHYQIKLVRLSWRQQYWLKQIGANLLVSTDYLAAKYSDWRPGILFPKPALPLTQDEESITVFYHGSGSHMAEIKWLYPVMEQVLKTNEQVFFQVFGNDSIKKMYSPLSRVSVVHPMSWKSYQAMLKHSQLDIGLAPLLDGSFNDARSYTKFFDITMAGGVGIYPEDSVFANVVKHESNGFLLPMKQDAWIAEICRLAENKEIRRKAYVNAAHSYESFE